MTCVIALDIKLKIDDYILYVSLAKRKENAEAYLVYIDNLYFHLTVKENEIKMEFSKGTVTRNNLQHRIKLLTLFGPIKQLGDEKLNFFSNSLSFKK